MLAAYLCWCFSSDRSNLLLCENGSNTYEEGRISYEPIVFSYESMFVSYEIGAVSYENVIISYETGTFSYEKLNGSYETIPISYETASFSHKKVRPFENLGLTLYVLLDGWVRQIACLSKATSPRSVHASFVSGRLHLRAPLRSLPVTGR